MKYLVLISSLLLTSCSNSNPISEDAIAAGMLSHAGVHNKKRAAGIEYISSEENVAKSTGDFVTTRWDTYQSGNKVATILQAQKILDETHAKINASFPKNNKPFVIPSNYKKLLINN